MPLDEIDLFNDYFLLLRKDLQNPATFALFLSVDHHDQVILFDMKLKDAHFKIHSSCRPADWRERAYRIDRPSKYFWSQRDNFHKPFGSKFPGDRPKDSSPNGFPLWVDEDGRVVIEFDVGPIETFYLFLRSDDDRTNHIPFFDLGIGQGVFD
jgi:hypothetical protein